VGSSGGEGVERLEAILCLDEIMLSPNGKARPYILRTRGESSTISSFIPAPPINAERSFTSDRGGWGIRKVEGATTER
jgi:hypothetical protein